MNLTADRLKVIISNCAVRLEEAADELNQLDGQLGDGDLGTSLKTCARNVRMVLPDTRGDLGDILKAAALACSRASGSSFGTLLAVGLLTAAKTLQGRQDLAPIEVPDLLDAVLNALQSRGGASLGDKTVLDAIEAVRVAIADCGDPAEQHDRAVTAVDAALSEFRHKPNCIGRARMFADRSVGLDDPGMVAFRHMVLGVRADAVPQPAT